MNKTLFREEVLQHHQTPQYGKVLENTKKCNKTLIKIIISIAIVLVTVTILTCVRHNIW